MFYCQGRRALSRVQTLKLKLAVADFKKVVALEPQNALARSQLETIQKLIRRTEFEKVCFRWFFFFLFLVSCPLDCDPLHKNADDNISGVLFRWRFGEG